MLSLLVVTALFGDASLVTARLWSQKKPLAATAAPAVFFTDVEAGPTRGGPGGLGIPIAIFGTGFGASRGRSTVTINGREVAAYLSWGKNAANNNGLDMIVAQPGGSVTSGAIIVSVGGRDRAMLCWCGAGTSTMTKSGSVIRSASRVR